MITSHKITTTLLAAFIMVMLFAAMPSPAAAIGWSLPATDLSPGPDVSNPQVAVAADGATTVVWTLWNGDSNVVQARTRLAGSDTFAAPVSLSDPGQSAENPQVAIGSDGATTVVWSRKNDGYSNVVQTRTRPAGSDTFAATVNLSASGQAQNSVSPQVVITADGATTIVWDLYNSGPNGLIQARTRPAGSDTFAAPVNLSAVIDNADPPQVAVAADGTTTVVWHRNQGVNDTIQARTRPAGSDTFAATVSLSPGPNVSNPQVAVAADGATTVVWTLWNGDSNVVQARTRLAGSDTFAAPVSLSDPGQSAENPQVAIGSDGATTVVWSRKNDGYSNVVQTRTRPAGSDTFAATVNLSASGQAQNSVSPQVVVAANGATTIVWDLYNSGPNGLIQASTRPAGSDTFAAPVNLSAVMDNADPPQVAVAADGTTTVVWHRNQGVNDTIQASTSNSEFMEQPPSSFKVFSVKSGVKVITSLVDVPSGSGGKVNQVITRIRKAKAANINRLLVCKTSRRVTKAGQVKLTCKINAATRARSAKLARLHLRPLSVRVHTTFLPSGGSSVKVLKRVRFF